MSIIVKRKLIAFLLLLNIVWASVFCVIIPLIPATRPLAAYLSNDYFTWVYIAITIGVFLWLSGWALKVSDLAKVAVSWQKGDEREQLMSFTILKRAFGLGITLCILQFLSVFVYAMLLVVFYGANSVDSTANITPSTQGFDLIALVISARYIIALWMDKNTEPVINTKQMLSRVDLRFFLALCIAIGVMVVIGINIMSVLNQNN